MAENNRSEELVKPRAMKPVTLEELVETSRTWNLGYTEEELSGLRDSMNNDLSTKYQRFSELASPPLPVKYQRTFGCRPSAEENPLNAWHWKCDIQGASDGILKGKTVAIKDSVCVAGIPMINGSKILEGYIPDIDATIVTRILDAGGHITGKSNCENLCLSPTSWTNCTGPTLNPIDPSRTTGGSSSGSAALVRNGEVDMAIGGDQGGSIRLPASFCGIVGMKPTWGLVPYTGAMSLETTIDHVGPMTRTVKDCALLLQAIAGYDGGLDPRQPSGLTIPKYSELLSGDLSGKRIGVVKEGFDGCDEDVISVVKQAINDLAEAGAVIENVSIPLHTDGPCIMSPLVVQGAYKCMFAGNGHGYNSKGFYHESMQETMSRAYQCRGHELPAGAKYFILLGNYLEKNYGNKLYGKAQNLVRVLRQAYDDALQKYDVLVMPTTQMKAPKIPLKTTPKEDYPNSGRFLKNTQQFDITGHPSLSINAGESEGLPIGMMITGKHFDEMMVLNIAYGFEQIREGK